MNKIIIQNPANIQDEVLWANVKSGSKEAFVYIYNKYADDLLRYGFHLVRDKSLVEDMIHDLFVSIWDKRNTTADVHSIKFYLMSALRRMLLRKMKKESSWQIKEVNEFAVISPSFLDVSFQEQDEYDLIEKVQTALNHLSPRQKEIIYLKFYQNLSYQEISELLGLDQKYTYNLASKAFASFKEQFGKCGLMILISCTSHWFI